MIEPTQEQRAAAEEVRQAADYLARAMTYAAEAGMSVDVRFLAFDASGKSSPAGYVVASVDFRVPEQVVRL